MVCVCVHVLCTLLPAHHLPQRPTCTATAPSPSSALSSERKEDKDCGDGGALSSSLYATELQKAANITILSPDIVLSINCLVRARAIL